MVTRSTLDVEEMLIVSSGRLVVYPTYWAQLMGGISYGLEKQYRSDNDASGLRHFGTFWGNSKDFLMSLEHWGRILKNVYGTRRQRKRLMYESLIGSRGILVERAHGI